MDDIKTLETKCEQIKEKSEMKQEERRKIMSDTKMLLKTKGEILTNIDKRKYQLLIEKEPVRFLRFLSSAEKMLGTIIYSRTSNSYLSTFRPTCSWKHL